MDSVLAGFQDLIEQSYGKRVLWWVGVQTQGFQRSFPNNISMVLQYCDANFLQHQDSRHFRNVNVFKKHHFVP